MLLGAFFFSTGGVTIKAVGLDGFRLAGLRAGAAVLAILVILPAARSLGTWRTWMVGLAYAVTALLFVHANQSTTAANSTFLQATSPIYILLMGPLLLKERLVPKDLAYLAVIALGMVLFFLGSEPALRTAPRPFFGNLLAAISGLTWALTIVGMRWLGRGTAAGGPTSGRGTAASAALCGNVILFGAMLPWILSGPAPKPLDWLLLAYLGTFQIGFAYLFITGAVGRLSALEASLLLILEPVLNPLWAYLIHGEVSSAWAQAGGLLILGATASKALGDLPWRRMRP